MSVPVAYRPTPSAYELEALHAIAAWKNPKRGWWNKAVDQVNEKWHDVTDLVRTVPGVDWVIENVVSGLLQLTNEITQDSVWTEAIYKEYQKAGHAVESTVHIRHMDLEPVDAAMQGLRDKYRALAAVEGAATGYAGISGIVPDIIALVTLNLRAAGEYAAYCGFDITQPDERLYALCLLDRVSQPSSRAKDVALAPVLRVSKSVAWQQSLQAMEQMAIGRAIKNITQALGLNLARVKLAQVIPVTGAVVGGSYNALYTAKVCDTAYHLYRERFLFEKYGPDVFKHYNV